MARRGAFASLVARPVAFAALATALEFCEVQHAVMEKRGAADEKDPETSGAARARAGDEKDLRTSASFAARAPRSWRICHCSEEEEEEEEELVSSCPCRGSKQDVHVSCFQKWHGTEQFWALNCATCNRGYAHGPKLLNLAKWLWERFDA